MKHLEFFTARLCITLGSSRKCILHQQILKITTTSQQKTTIFNSNKNVKQKHATMFLSPTASLVSAKGQFSSKTDL